LQITRINVAHRPEISSGTDRTLRIAKRLIGDTRRPGLISQAHEVSASWVSAGLDEERSRQRVRDQVAHMPFEAETLLRSSARGSAPLSGERASD
jgi:hypothetical protein